MDDIEVDGADVVACTRCPELCASRSRIVNGVGPADASLVLVGEAPGRREDETGEPFVGRSGDVLDEVLRGAGTSREAVRITNCVRCRPPDNRDPRVGERDSCHEHVEREFSVVDPEVIVTLGKVPGEELLDRSVAVTDEAGSVVEARLGGKRRRVVISVHPAATLYDGSQREPFEGAIETAVDLAGLADGGDGQRRLGEY
ncbi:uracil-DNA glycosylase [Halobacteriales archaeon SW_7_68_16]|nr:MAG: uracil-DNA glycosylase [Halobacteriales archaeon SW_7_68_16]